MAFQDVIAIYRVLQLIRNFLGTLIITRGDKTQSQFKKRAL